MVLIAATVDGVVGWGECGAQPEPTYSPEYVDGAIDVLGRHLIPRCAAGPTPRTWRAWSGPWRR